MRPVHLSVAGLHSFREKQEVDFESLCAGGVFGIFGPTGSGKSSILDAITLALYGKVERAVNHVQGIMNHAEDQLAVSFTFELGQKERLKRYRVQRVYKRTGENSLRTSTCRLIQLSKENADDVIADKEREVTQKIQELLGLTIDDFTRAVVLPQGKFAEFLSLKGAERRQMLQRIFHLEQYGDRLNSNLKRRLEKVNSELDKITAEQQGLGDASLAALETVKKQLLQTEQEVREQRSQLLQMEKQYEQNKLIWTLQEEQKRVQEKLSLLHAQAGEILQLEQQLERSRQAEQVKPYAEELEAALESHQHWQEKEALLLQEVSRCTEQFSQSAAAYNEAQKMRLAEEPKLVIRQEQLKQAQILEEEIIAAEKELQDIKASLQHIETQKKEYEEELHKQHALKERALARQNELKKLLEERQVSSEHRVKVRRACEEKKEIIYIEQTYSQLLKEVEKESLLLKQEERKRKQLGKETEQIERRLSAQLVETEQLYNQIKELDKQLDVLQLFITKEIKVQKEAYDQERQQQLAYQLAHSLRKGEPCPVCGSMEHPQPNNGKVEVDRPGTKRIEQLEDAVQQGKVAQNQLSKYIYQLEQITAAISEGASTFVSAQLSTSSASAVTNLPLKDKSSDLQAMESDRLLHLLQQAVGICQAYQNELLILEETAKRDLKSWREYQTQLAQLQTTIGSKEKEIEELENRRKELSSSIDAQKTKWKKTYPSFHYEKIEEEQLAIDKQDQETIDLAQRIEKSVLYLEEREREIKRLQEKVNQLQIQWVELETKSLAHDNTLQRQKKQFSQYVEMEEKINVKELLDQVANKLLQLKASEKTTYDHFQQWQQQLQMKEKECSVARESLNQATERKQRALAKWREVTADSAFTSIEDVYQVFISKEEQTAIRERVTAYRDQEKECLQEQRKIEQQLQGKIMTSKEWQEVQEQLEQAKLARDIALEANAKAVRDLEYLQKKHSRFNELEEMRVDLEKKQQQLSKLHSVFRGNSFVEFVATEQLVEVSRDASYRLGQLTRQRYALEVDSSLGFVIRDDANGGIRRPVSTLSGGETFLTSLALALALSTQIQLRGEYPLEFFFLDEGFGTLDQELLDTVITALEKLHTERLSVGVISHVPELRARLPRRLIVQPAEPSGAGSRVRVEPSLS